MFVQWQQSTETGNLLSNDTRIFTIYRAIRKKKSMQQTLPNMAIYICFYVIQRRVSQTSEKISHVDGISHKNKQVIVHKTASTTTHKRSTFFFVRTISSDAGTLEMNNEQELW
jgi:hypothetical protein